LNDIEAFFQVFPSTNPNHQLVFEALCKDKAFGLIVAYLLNKTTVPALF
jgi:hypothetical protein